jgi:hypothetical protein
MFSQHPQTQSLKDFIASENAQDKEGLKKLNLLEYKGHIQISNGNHFRLSELYLALQTCPGVEEVDLSGHAELSNIAFAQFRKHLPHLKSVKLYNHSPSSCQITGDEFAKFYLKNIVIIADATMMAHIRHLVNGFLIENNQVKYAAKYRSIGTIEPAQFQKAFTVASEKIAEKEKHKRCQEIITLNHQIDKRDQLFKDYKNGEGFDIKSVWWIDGPKNPSDFSGQCATQELCLLAFTLYLVITKNNAWLEIKNNANQPLVFFAEQQRTQHRAMNNIRRNSAVLSCDNPGGESIDSMIALMEVIQTYGSFAAYRAVLEESSLSLNLT